MSDIDRELVEAARHALGLMGMFGLDFDRSYSRLLAAVDAKERETSEAQPSSDTRGLFTRGST